MGLNIPSAAEYAENKGSDFSLFPSDDYIVEIKEIIVQKDKPDIYNPGKFYDELQVRMRVVSFANGDPLVDENGDDMPDDRLFFAFVNPARVGLLPVPAYARKFFAAALGVSIEDRIEIEDFADLIGKRLIVVVIIKPNQKGVRKNKVVDFRPIRRRPTRKVEAADPKAEAAAKLSEAATAPEVAKVAKEVFGDDMDDLPF